MFRKKKSISKLGQKNVDYVNNCERVCIVVVMEMFEKFTEKKHYFLYESHCRTLMNTGMQCLQMLPNYKSSLFRKGIYLKILINVSIQVKMLQ